MGGGRLMKNVILAWALGGKIPSQKAAGDETTENCMREALNVGRGDAEDEGHEYETWTCRRIFFFLIIIFDVYEKSFFYFFIFDVFLFLTYTRKVFFYFFLT